MSRVIPIPHRARKVWIAAWQKDDAKDIGGSFGSPDLESVYIAARSRKALGDHGKVARQITLIPVRRVK